MCAAVWNTRVGPARSNKFTLGKSRKTIHWGEILVDVILGVIAPVGQEQTLRIPALIPTDLPIFDCALDKRPGAGYSCMNDIDI